MAGSPRHGFIVNDAEVTGLDSNYDITKVVLLHEDSAADAKSSALPSGARWSHLELWLDETGATVATIQAFLTWDSAGDKIAAGPTQTAITVVAGMTDTSLRMCVIPLDDIVPVRPTGATAAGQVYLHLKSDAGGFSVPAGSARLHWHLLPRG